AEVDCLINNAGFGDYGSFASSDLAKQERMIAVNITALTALTRLFLPAMLEQGAGHILNVASVTGFLPGPLMSVYFASKHYVLAAGVACCRSRRICTENGAAVASRSVRRVLLRSPARSVDPRRSLGVPIWRQPRSRRRKWQAMATA